MSLGSSESGAEVEGVDVEYALGVIFRLEEEAGGGAGRA